jgi:hypothetical protein
VQITPLDLSNLEENGWHIKYFKGKPLKVDLSGDKVNPWGYDRDAGAGTFERVVQKMRAGLTQ